MQGIVGCWAVCELCVCPWTPCSQSWQSCQSGPSACCRASLCSRLLPSCPLVVCCVSGQRAPPSDVRHGAGSRRLIRTAMGGRTHTMLA